MRGHLRIASAASLIGSVGLAAALAWLPARADEAAEHAQAVAVAAATERAARWLDALDTGAYSESWNAVAAVMKAGRHEEEWISDVAAPRATLGKPSERELQDSQFATSVRGAPHGEYVTATFVSQFANAPPTVETVLLTLEDGQWRIAGYNVYPVSSPDAPAAPADKAGPGTPAKPER